MGLRLGRLLTYIDLKRFARRQRPTSAPCEPLEKPNTVGEELHRPRSDAGAIAALRQGAESYPSLTGCEQRHHLSDSPNARPKDVRGIQQVVRPRKSVCLDQFN